MINYQELCSDWQAIGECVVDDEICDSIRITAKSGGTEVWAFGRATHLLVQVERTWVVGRRRIGVVGRISDYREVDGVLIPFLIVQSSQVDGKEFTMRTQYTVVAHDPPDVRPSMFELPARIRKLKLSAASSQPADRR